MELGWALVILAVVHRSLMDAARRGRHCRVHAGHGRHAKG